MSQTPNSYGTTPTAAEIAAECRQLIDRLERHRLNTSLLLRARSGLEMILGYKQNRNMGNRLRARPP